MVGEVWEPGAQTGICAYQDLILGVQASAATYHSAANDPGIHDIVFSTACGQNPLQVTLDHGARIQPGLLVNLGTEAKMIFLYANGVTESEPNDNSLVARLDLGSKRVLFMGDAGGGERRDPSKAAKRANRYRVAHWAPPQCGAAASQHIIPWWLNSGPLWASVSAKSAAAIPTTLVHPRRMLAAAAAVSPSVPPGSSPAVPERG